MTRHVIALTLALLVAGSMRPDGADAQGLPHYRFPGLRGRIVADETGQALAGVLVLAVWSPGTSSSFAPKTVRVLETESHSDGTFELPPWEGTLSAPVSSESPSFAFLAPDRDANPTRPWAGSPKNPSEFRLRRFDGLPENRASQLRKLAWGLGLVWTHLYGQPPPRMLSELDRAWQQLPPESQGSGSPSQMFEGTVRLERSAYEEEMLKRK